MPARRRPKTIILSSSRHTRDHDAKLADGWITKPVRRTELERALIRLKTESGAEPAHGEPPVAAATRDADLEARQLRVLLAEDNPVNQMVAVRILERAGCTVVVAENGRAAVAAVEKFPFDVILMDIQMPEMDGFEATAAIRTAEQYTGGHVGIIALTANVIRGERERCIAAGMDEYLSKPIRPASLLALVSFIAKSRTHRQVLSPTQG
jgi:CheY-like chemotaxis protein